MGKPGIANILGLLLFVLNLCITLFPVIPLDFSNPIPGENYFEAFHGRANDIVSSYISPILTAFCVVYYLLWKGGGIAGWNRRINIAAAMTFLALALSLFANPPGEIKVIFIVIYFMVANLFLFAVMDNYFTSSHVALVMLRRVLTLWVLLPLVLTAISPSLVNIFFFKADHGLHGFADGRVGYGLWTGLLIILLLTQQGVYLRKWLLVASIIALTLSQSRAGVGSLGLACIYFYYAKQGGLSNAFIRKFAVIAAATMMVLVGWAVFGRGAVFTILNPPRPQIYAAFFDYIRENWLFGYGSMYSITVPGVLNAAPAHNLIIQVVANFGVIAAACFMLYWVLIYLDVKTMSSRMVYIFLFVYSQMEPIQGTANFFSPITMIWFMVIIMLHRSRDGAGKLENIQPGSAPESGGDAGFIR